MKRVLLRAALIGAVATIIAVASANAGSGPTPILIGGGARSSVGFGKVKPGKIFLGGDPTGLVCAIHWISWGGQFAIGTGTGFYLGPHQITAAGHQAPAVVVLSHLGTWYGRPAYTKYTWYFPQGGSTYGGVTPCSA
jgi:hypothetical protein